MQSVDDVSGSFGISKESGFWTSPISLPEYGHFLTVLSGLVS
jgi:hypothetical protein